MIINSNINDAIFNFGIAQQRANNNKNDILAANTSIAIAYAVKGGQKETAYYFCLILSDFKNLRLNKSNLCENLK